MVFLTVILRLGKGFSGSVYCSKILAVFFTDLFLLMVVSSVFSVAAVVSCSSGKTYY